MTDEKTIERLDNIRKRLADAYADETRFHIGIEDIKAVEDALKILKAKNQEQKEWNMVEPTEKQRSYAYDIARWLDIPLPKEKSKKAYADFISKNVDEFKKAKMRNFLDDNDYGYDYGMGTWDIGL